MATPEDLVRKAEAAYASLDIDRIMDLFDRDIVQYWNGKKTIEGWDALRQDHLDGFLRMLPDGSPGIEDYSIKKALRMACGDMIGVEWVSSFLDRTTGEWVDEHGAEYPADESGRDVTAHGAADREGGAEERADDGHLRTGHGQQDAKCAAEGLAATRTSLD